MDNLITLLAILGIVVTCLGIAILGLQYFSLVAEVSKNKALTRKEIFKMVIPFYILYDFYKFNKENNRLDDSK